MQIKEVKVKFEDGGREYSFDCTNCFVKFGNKVVVETVRGTEIGEICSRVITRDLEEHETPLKKVLRLAGKEDFAQRQNVTQKANEIKNECERLVDELKLDMKIVSADISLDESKVLICFTSSDRVDFRELVKRLAITYKIKIELKQIDAREETKFIGGLGPCGRECCCSNFLKEPTHSSIKMAKTQGLALNPSNISGLCGKLKCCLSYENEYYSEVSALMPKINSEVMTPSGKGTVVYNNLLKKIVSVKFENGENLANVVEFELSEIKPLEKK